jgi:hypothetical protein
MSYPRYKSTRTGERDDPFDPDYYSPGTLIRRDSKRQHYNLYDDDEYDDYPYSSKQSRALITRRPSQIEKYNIWANPKRVSFDDERRRSYDRDYDNNDDDFKIRYKHTSSRYAQPSDDESDREREFRLKIKTTFGRPRQSESSTRRIMAWPGEVFKRREKYEDEDWETRDRERRGEWWNEQEPQLRERTVKYRKVKRTRTDQWRPLSGWRRS